MFRPYHVKLLNKIAKCKKIIFFYSNLESKQKQLLCSNTFYDSFNDFFNISCKYFFKLQCKFSF